MVSRREFVLGGIAVSALPVIASAASPAPLPTAGLPELALSALYKVIYDQRFPASVDYGRAASRRGHAVHAIRGDMTDLWYHDLHPRWKQDPVGIAGLTQHGPLFCLERLSWDFGMRVTFRQERPGELISWVIAPARPGGRIA
jgi:hypothetical protein